MQRKRAGRPEHLRRGWAWAFGYRSTLALVLAACAAPAVPLDPQPTISQQVYRCAGDLRFAVDFVEGRAILHPDAKPDTLHQVIAASGARYEGDGTLFWEKGREAFLESATANYQECIGQEVHGPWERAHLLGYTVRGIGQEPGWLIEIGPGRTLHLALDYGSTEIMTGIPREELLAEGEIRRFEAASSAGPVIATITREPCTDPMSGEAFPERVQVEVAERSYEGCARELGGPTGRALTTSAGWSLMQLGGVPALPDDAGELPELRFERSEPRWAGSTGCNLISGAYAHEDGQLSFPEPIVSTRRACLAVPLAEQEADFLRVLRETRRFLTWGDVLSLYGEGEQLLARFVAVDAG